MGTRTIDIHLGYFKQGDDLANCLGETNSPVEALKAHAERMRSVAEHLDKIAAIVADFPIEINADTHHIEMTCDEDLAQKLIDEDLAENVEDLEDEIFVEDAETEIDPDIK